MALSPTPSPIAPAGTPAPAPAPIPALQTAGLTKSYFGHRVVRDVSLTVPSGQIYGLLGSNGAGKSTFMKMACGFVLPTAGSVSILGRPMKPGEGHPRVGALIERPGLQPGLTALDNVMCRALALGLPDPKAQSAQALELVGLSASSRERAASLSLGTKQRLGMALALVGTPDLLFLDEPFNGIDVAGTVDLRDALLHLVRERNVTVVVSSHIIDQLARFVTRYGVLVNGRLTCEKTAEQVERDCTECLCLATPAPQRALAVLADAFPQAQFTLLESGQIRITPNVDPAAVARALVDADVPLTSLHTQAGDLEAYFAQLMAGGAAHA